MNLKLDPNVDYSDSKNRYLFIEEVLGFDEDAMTILLGKISKPTYHSYKYGKTLMPVVRVEILKKEGFNDRWVNYNEGEPFIKAGKNIIEMKRDTNFIKMLEAENLKDVLTQFLDSNPSSDRINWLRTAIEFAAQNSNKNNP
ncbi:hypothetical protein LFX25_20520 [Leptospira sp. FAT2]|uniref:hypothetical protein n=1 Tax=Leptospira sanjuanensis TaxID=2879643 RepID=UPI001EE79BB9|nr:hypothetical protein [Leptospira sanjuanensis]MCG6195631.1 hypothetical protein [Leptospira sanjuanensis]